MNNLLEYKGYYGAVEYDDAYGVLQGDVLLTRDVVTFHGQSVNEVRKAFRDSVDDYLEHCRSRGEPPEKPFSGELVTRIDPELQWALSARAAAEGVSLDYWILERLKRAAEEPPASVNLPSTIRRRKRPAGSRKRRSAPRPKISGASRFTRRSPSGTRRSSRSRRTSSGV